MRWAWRSGAVLSAGLLGVVGWSVWHHPDLANDRAACAAFVAVADQGASVTGSAQREAEALGARAGNHDIRGGASLYEQTHNQASLSTILDACQREGVSP